MFIIISKIFPEHVRTYILYHSLYNLMQIPFLSKFWSTPGPQPTDLFGGEG